MTMQMIHLLLIEDNSADAVILQDALAGDESPASFTVTVSERLSEGLKQLSEQSFDLILLDLGLPDSQGLETLNEVGAEHPGVPVVVLTGRTDKEIGIQAVSQGAQDYLVKGQINTETLERVIRYAIERQHLQETLAKTRQSEQRERELRSLAELAVPATTSVTARTFGIQTIHEISEDIFAKLGRKYGELLDLAIEQRAFKVEHPISERLRSLAMEIGLLKGGPRDVIELHTYAINKIIETAKHERSQAYVEEGRLLVLELMGHLVTHYRTQSRTDAKQ
jgi:DNA-binding response OmpR family regulator